jgi:Protein of unknown function (DUF3224)
MPHAKGHFDVSITPADDAGSAGPTLGRMIIGKAYHGDLEANSSGQMLTATTDIADSAGYVAVERISGVLHSRTGSFVLQHSGTMNRGIASLSVTVVPDSGTSELQGIAGSLTITITDGTHYYDLEYTLPDHGHAVD